MATSPFPDPPPEMILPLGVLVMIVGAFVGVPVGIVVGVPLLSCLGPYIQRHRIAASIALGLIGLAGGWMVGSALGSAEGQAGLIFRCVIGAMHGSLYPAKHRAKASRGWLNSSSRYLPYSERPPRTYWLRQATPRGQFTTRCGHDLPSGTCLKAGAQLCPFPCQHLPCGRRPRCCRPECREWGGKLTSIELETAFLAASYCCPAWAYCTGQLSVRSSEM
jgi:hypothetical protein